MRAQETLTIPATSLLVALLLSGCGDSLASKSTDPEQVSDSEPESDTDDTDTGLDAGSTSDSVETDSGSESERDSETDDTHSGSDGETWDTATECTEGPCCDDSGFFKGPLDEICDKRTEHRCAKGVCGAGPEFRTVLIFCSGSSAECNGDRSDPAWTPFNTCQYNEVCEMNEVGVPQCLPCGELELCEAGACACKFETCPDGCCAEGQVCGWADTCRSRETKLLPDVGAENEQFGRAVSLSGDTALIGARGSASSGAPAGAVHHFERDDSGNWNYKAMLVPSNGSEGDDFGHSVTVSGNVAIIGAPGDDGMGTASGAAYVFERSTSGDWIEKAKLLVTDGAAGDSLGCSVSISGDFAVLGAENHDNELEDSGAAYIFERSTSGDWVEKAKLIPSDEEEGDYLGSSVAIDQDFAVIGARGNDDKGSNSGAAYIFERDASGGWVQKAKLLASRGGIADHFGHAVSISGETAIIGAPREDDKGSNSGAAYIFERDAPGNWTEKFKLLASDGAKEDNFGGTVSISGDWLIIGADGDQDNGVRTGSAYIFERGASGEWIQKSKLLPSDGSNLDFFGTSVSISEKVAIVGASGNQANGKNAGAAYIF